MDVLTALQERIKVQQVMYSPHVATAQLEAMAPQLVCKLLLAQALAHQASTLSQDPQCVLI